ncbi:MAG: 5'/3'-nucleotidase SurE [Thermoprotei archaeon]
MIVVTNDDGVRSPGILALFRAVSGLGEKVEVVAPDGPQSAAGMSITFFKPLRIERVEIDDGYRAYAVSGSPTDSVFLARYKLMKDKPIKLVVSGINLGENLTLQSFYTSGTVSAALAAALNGIKGIAFSMVIDYKVEPPVEAFGEASKFIRSLVSKILQVGFPDEVDVLSVNFPAKITRQTKVKVVPMASTMFDEYVLERRDPRGRKYFWLGGNIKSDLESNTDVHTVLVEKNISVTPIKLTNYSPEAMRSTQKLVALMGNELKTTV